ncbi:MAG: hypothetical protein GY867_01725 [bacterium]|nr:hypothetical protein [bacterium]
MPPYARMRADLVSSSSVVDGATVYTIKDPIAGNYFRLREPEFWLLNRLDGEAAPGDIARGFKAKFDLDIPAEAVEQFIGTMEGMGFLESSSPEKTVGREEARPWARRSLFGRLLFIKVKGFTPGRFLDALTRWYQPFHRPFWFVLQAALILLGLGLLAVNSRHFAVDLVELWNLGSVATIVLSLFILLTLHEFAHAVICRRLGGEVREIGFLLMYFQPCFYCDLSDAWLFEKKSERLAVTWAGPYFQLVLLASSVVLWRLSVEGSFANQLAWTLVTVNWINYLFNFNPLIKLDGYYLLSDWLEIPNLRQKAFGYLGNVFKRRLLGWPIKRIEVSPREKRVFLTYGSLALFYSTSLLVYIFWLVSRFLLVKTGPLGLMLFFVVLLVILRSSLAGVARGIATHFGFMKQLLKKPVRLTVYLVLLILVVILSVAVPFPRRVSGDVSVRPIAEFTLSHNEFGLLESTTRYGGQTPATRSGFIQMASSDMVALNMVPLVKDGHTVRQGDTVAMVTSNQITKEIETGRAELDRLNGTLTLLQAAPKKEEVAEASAQVTAARANLAQLQRDLDRVTSLVEKNMEPAERLETKKAEVEIAEAELSTKTSALELLQAPPRPEEVNVIEYEIEKQRAQLAFLTEQAEAQHVVAPFDGLVVSGRSANCILAVARNDVVELLVPVSDFDIALISLQQRVQVKVRSYPNETFYGSVVRVPEVAVPRDDGHVFPVAVVVDNDKRLLRDGMTGYAKIETGESSLASLALRKLYSVLKVEFWSWW